MPGDELERKVKERTSELMKANRKLKELSITDDLTGLFNRRQFLRELDSEYRRALRYGRSLALLLLDVDHFKKLNDRYGHLPDLVLPVPQDQAEKAYLGLKTGDTFRNPQIAADVVIVEIFSMYCPHCQKEAPRINELYDIVSKQANRRSRIKMIGIGAGNSEFETKEFKDQYQVPFPLLPDVDFTIHKLVGEVRTPYFIAVETRSDGWNRVLYSRVGGIEDPQKFLDFLLKEVSGQ